MNIEGAVAQHLDGWNLPKQFPVHWQQSPGCVGENGIEDTRLSGSRRGRIWMQLSTHAFPLTLCKALF